MVKYHLLPTRIFALASILQQLRPQFHSLEGLEESRRSRPASAYIPGPVCSRTDSLLSISGGVRICSVPATGGRWIAPLRDIDRFGKYPGGTTNGPIAHHLRCHSVTSPSTCPVTVRSTSTGHPRNYGCESIRPSTRVSALAHLHIYLPLSVCARAVSLFATELADRPLEQIWMVTPIVGQTGRMWSTSETLWSQLGPAAASAI